MKKKNKLKRRGSNHIDKLASFYTCGGQCDLQKGNICEECFEWSWHLTSPDKQGHLIRVID